MTNATETKAAAAETKMKTRLRSIYTAQLIEMAEQLNTDFEIAETDIVFEYVLSELGIRMSDAEYIDLMARLEAAN